MIHPILARDRLSRDASESENVTVPELRYPPPYTDEQFKAVFTTPDLLVEERSW